MQRIFQTSLTPEQYAEQAYQKQVPAPENCPNCARAHALEGLAYYHRYITTATAIVLMIWVRRFLCRHCRVSVSCLPSFAQPYRLVNTPTIEAGFNGQSSRQILQRVELPPISLVAKVRNLNLQIRKRQLFLAARHGETVPPPAVELSTAYIHVRCGSSTADS